MCIRDSGSEPYPWATRIEQRLKLCISGNDNAALVDYFSLDPEARLAIPTPEHYLPLLYVLGARLPADEVRFPLEGIDLGSISMLSFSLA